MNFIVRMQKLNASRSAYWLLVFRVVLGLALFFKGIQFIRNEALLSEVLSTYEGIRKFRWLQLFIPIMHMFGGLMILIGLFTRLACLAQIPIVLGAVIFVKQDSRTFPGGLELPFAMVILLMLIFFLILGDGPLSWKQLIRGEKSIT